ncbi:MAG: flagellar basal body P-ring formation protein FlgA [Curvibacter sp.]|nr:flagellar basal body P-ring formation protein FlgA [Curvibacter sp.]
MFKLMFSGPWSLAVLLGLAATAVHAQAPDEAMLMRIELKAHATVSKAAVCLGDVAALTSPNVDLLRKVANLPLGHVSAANSEVSLSRERILPWLKRQVGLRDDQIEWSGASQVGIVREDKPLPADKLLTVAQAELRQQLDAVTSRLKLNQARVEIEPTREGLSISLPAGVDRLSVRPLSAAALNKRMRVWVEAYEGDQFVRTIPVDFNVHVFAAVPVARVDLPMGGTLPANELELQEVDVASLGSDPLWTPDHPAAGYRLKQDVRKGEALTRSRVEGLPAVLQGDSAKLVLQDGDLQVETQVQVLEDGQIGQQVRVRAKSSHELILARVSAPGVVELQP